MSPLTERCTEKYGKKLIGRTDLEDGLKRLDKLTHEEARMATAEVLRMTHAIDEAVTGVREQVHVVDDRVAEVINGSQIIFSQARELLNLNPSDGKETNKVIKQTANDVDQVKRSSPPDILFLRLTVPSR
jgi:hypothetical protein